jgi:hypothetical protein
MRSTGERGNFNRMDSKHDEIKNESGLARFIGVVALLIFVIGLGGGFTAQAASEVDWNLASDQAEKKEFEELCKDVI